MTAALEGGEWSAARPGHTLLSGKTRYPFYRRLGGPQGRSGRAENVVPSGIRSRNVQSVAQSLYRLSYRAHMKNNVHKQKRKRKAKIKPSKTTHITIGDQETNLMSQFIKFYFTSSMLNMFRTLIHPLSGVCDFPIVSPH